MENQNNFSSQKSFPKFTGLTADSRSVKPGFLFAALPGNKNDGRAFIPQAIAAGATAILAPPGTSLPDNSNITLIEDENPRRRLALMAAEFYGRQPKTIVAVTGTNGKTSTATFAAQMWQLLHHKAAALGTLGLYGSGFERPGALTTPDPVTLHALLKEVAEAGIEHLALEASSHGLEQHRLDGVRVVAGGFTNLTRDHLDYHGTMEAYFEAKTLLFTRIIQEGGTAVLNADVPPSEKLLYLCQKRKLKTLTYGRQGKDLKIHKAALVPHGQHLDLEILGQRVKITLPLIGEFQTWNALCALGLVIGTGSDPIKATQTLAHLQPVRGRVEKVGQLSNGATVYVDYAHTPDGLQTVLQSLRPHAATHLHVVFGCGGDRDRGKRPIMGRIACTLADHVIITDDNPRTENAAAIRAEILTGCTSKAQEIGDRAKAIWTAILDLEKDEVLVIAGKGHEQGQIVGKDVLPFDDAEVAREVLKEIGK